MKTAAALEYHELADLRQFCRTLVNPYTIGFEQAFYLVVYACPFVDADRRDQYDAGHADGLAARKARQEGTP